MKESITKFDLEAAFKALDEIEMPKVGSVKANRPALNEIFSRKTKFDVLMEEYYDIGNMEELDDAKEAREAEVAQAKLARIEKIVDLDAESPEDLLPSYVGKFIMQCPQCMTLFYKNPEDVEASEEDPNTVNVAEVCQHCGNEAGYTLIGKVGEATQEEMSDFTQEETVDVTSTDEGEEEFADEMSEEPSDEELDIDLDELGELDLDIEDDEAEKAEESFATGNGSPLVEQLNEDVDAVKVREVQDAIKKLFNDKPDKTVEAVNTILDTIPDEDLDAILDSVKETFKDIKITETERKDISSATGGEVPEDADTLGKVLELCDMFEWADKAPKLIKTVIVIGCRVAGALEPTFAGEAIAGILSLLPAEIISKIVAALNTLLGGPLVWLGHGANQLHKKRKAASESLTEGSEDLEVSAEEFEELIKSPEFKKPISDTEARAMMDEVEGEKEEVKESKLTEAALDPDSPVADNIYDMFNSCKFTYSRMWENPPKTKKVSDDTYLVTHRDGGDPLTVKFDISNPEDSTLKFSINGKKCETKYTSEAQDFILKELEAARVKSFDLAIDESLEEGIFDKLKDKLADTVDNITTKLKSREAKADWLLANAKKDYNAVKADAKGQLVPDKNNQRFRTFVVIGYTSKDNKGSTIKYAPDFDDKNLVIGKNGVQYKAKYEDADNIAKGWSMAQGNGPAFIYLANGKDDDNAVFLCEYFVGKLYNDQLEKYLKVVKNHLKGAKLMAKGGISSETDEDEATATSATEDVKPLEDAGTKTVAKEDVAPSTSKQINISELKQGMFVIGVPKVPKIKLINGVAGQILSRKDQPDNFTGVPENIHYIVEFEGIPELDEQPPEHAIGFGADDKILIAEKVNVIKKQTNENLSSIMCNLEELQEATLEKHISDSLIESYGNVAGFRLTDCSYENNKFTVDGTIYFTSGNKRNTSYVFTEAMTKNNKVSIRGLNEKLGLDKQFTITGHTANKTFITESFKTIKK